MDLVRYMNSDGNLQLLDLDDISMGCIQANVLYLRMKNSHEQFEFLESDAARIRQALVLKSRILPDVKKT